MIESLKNIVIIGGGAGGLELATSLGRKLGRRKRAKIILVDRNHSHLWKPLLHEVATGSLDEGIDAISYMAHAHNNYFQFQFGSMHDIDRKNKHVLLDEIRDAEGDLLVQARRLNYDILVIATGSTSNDFNTLGVKEYCVFLDNTEQARRLHNTMLNLFLKFSIQSKIKDQDQVRIAIVGGGATGVELSAELHNAVRQLQSYGFKGLSNQALRVTIIEAGDRILPSLSIRIASAVQNELTKLGVQILTKTMVISADKKGLHTKNGEYIQAELMVWAAGIKVPDFMNNLGELETNSINQLVVNQKLQTTRDSEIFAIGDCAYCMMNSGLGVPPRAQAAHQMASVVQHNIIALLRGQSLMNYVYKDHGSLVSLSRFSTIGSLMGNLTNGSMMIEGRIARAVYISLYRMHQVALHGYFKTGLIMLVSRINRVIRPRLKLH